VFIRVNSWLKGGLPYSASFGNSYAHAQKTVLTASQNDIAAKSGTTLGGAFITDDGRWKGALPSPSTARF
jgi:hypothetical protein